MKPDPAKLVEPTREGLILAVKHAWLFRRGVATDGTQPYIYWGSQKDIWAIFNFFVGDDCMTGVSLEQSSKIRKVRTENFRY